MVFRPMPGHALADIHLEVDRSERNGFLQRLPCFLRWAGLAERGGEPAIGIRKLGVQTDRPFCRLGRGLVLMAKIKTDRDLLRASCRRWSARCAVTSTYGDERDDGWIAAQADWARTIQLNNPDLFGRLFEGLPTGGDAWHKGLASLTF